MIIALLVLALPAGALPPPPAPLLAHWAKVELIAAYEMGLIADWPIDPDRAILRREAGRILAEALGLAPSPATAPFSDLAADDPDGPWFSTLYMEGVFRGDDCGRLNPDAPLTRAEYAAIAARAALPLLAATGPELTFADTVGHWAAAEIAGATRLGLVMGTAASTFAPDRTVTVAEAVVMTVRLVSGDPRADVPLPTPTELAGLAKLDLELWADGYSHTPVPDWEHLYANRTGAALLVAREVAATEDASRRAGHSGVAVIESATVRVLAVRPLSALLELTSAGLLVRDGQPEKISDVCQVSLRRQRGRWIIYKVFR